MKFGCVCFALACSIGAVIAQEQVPGTAGPHDTISDVKFGSIVPIVRETGLVSLSVDGLGTNAVSGVIQVQKPAGATVRGAYMAAATTGFSGRVLVIGDVRIDGVAVSWTIQTPSSLKSSNHWANVTSIVKKKIDAAPAGRVSFSVTEVNSGGIDGEILAVVFDDPNETTVNTVALLFGAQAVGGDTFALGLADPIDKTDSALALQMGLGIAFGLQQGNNGVQHSTLDVNGARLSSSAGGEDDGLAQNGALLTVGGLDDSPANPANPFANSGPNGFRTDDELYDLVPLVSNGATGITVFTRNPSNDDNIFFASFFLRSTTAVVGEGIVLAPTSATTPVGNQHTVTATIQDSLGLPVTGRLVTFTVKKGPHAGLTDTAFTDNTGKARYTYNGNSPGVDNIEARASDQAGQVLVSNVAVSEFFKPNESPTISCPPPVTVERQSPAGADITLTVQATDPDAEPITVTWNLDGVNAQTDNVLGLPSGPTRVTLRRTYSLGTHTVAVTANDGEADPVSCSTTVNVTAATTDLSVVAASGSYRGTTTLQAFLTTDGAGLSNESVSFSLDGTAIGSAITDSNGLATLPGVSLGAINAGAYPNGVQAGFGGDAEFKPSTGAAALTVLKATPTVNVTGGTFTYDGDQHPAIGSVFAVNGAPLGGLSFTYNGSSGAPVNAGQYAVVGSIAETANHVAASGAATITITKATPFFSELSSRTIALGSATTELSGRIAAGATIPGGDVLITLNGLTQAAAIGVDGRFSWAFATATLPVVYPAHPVTFTHGGSNNFTGALGGAKLLVTNSRELSSEFNSAPILAGNFIWFNSSIRLFRHGVAGDDAGDDENPGANGNAVGTGNTRLAGPATVHVFAQQIAFTVNGAPVVLPVPDAVVRFSATATIATTRFDETTGMWETTVPVGYDGDVFLAGLAHLVPTSYPGKLGPVKWSGTFLSDQTTDAVKWQWGAAVYSAFSSDYPALGVKPVDGKKASAFDDNDKAGTPENFTQYLIKGARSGGQSNHAGSRTKRLTVAP